MNNSAYLKDYVRMHPDNRMAWYLLGKEYEQSGQEAKANYCYMQAGDIYEAFEASKTPAEIWEEYAEELMSASKRKAKNRTRARRWLIALWLLILASLPASWMAAPDDGQVVKQAQAGAASNIRQTAAGAAGAGAAQQDGQESGPAFTAKAADSAADRAGALSSLLAGEGPQPQPMLGVLGMQKAGKWLLWSRDMPLEFAIKQDASRGQTSVQALNPADCGCQPPKDAKLAKQATEWIENQEMLAVLTSAIAHFHEKQGAYPAKLSALNRTFPDNWIAGDSPQAAALFKTALTSVKAETNGGGSQGGGSPADSSDGTANTATAEGPFFKEPLQIMVDKEKHLLALVSGNVVLRTYQVGLGGERTPEGTYRIEEKVINPNGHADGEFGSRGMGLTGGQYAIHGTNEEDSIGKDESQGCIRMGKADVEELFDLAPKGTVVTIGKGILPELTPGTSSRFKFPDRQDQSNPHKTYHWLS